VAKEKFCIVYSTFPKRRKATQMAKLLLRENLIACANIFKIDSIYRWKEKVEETKEYAVFFKTKKSLYTQVETKIKEFHPYECPAIIEIPITKGLSDYLSWIEKETHSTS